MHRSIMHSIMMHYNTLQCTANWLACDRMVQHYRVERLIMRSGCIVQNENIYKEGSLNLNFHSVSNSRDLERKKLRIRANRDPHQVRPHKRR